MFFCAKPLLPEGSYITVVANGTHIMIEYGNFQIAAGVPSLQVYLAQVRLIGHHVSLSLCTTMKAPPLLRVRCQHSQRLIQAHFRHFSDHLNPFIDPTLYLPSLGPRLYFLRRRSSLDGDID